MVKHFLGKLTDSLNKQFSVGENQNTNLSTIVDGQTIPYGQLGDYASRIDQTEERKYFEEGYLRTDSFSSKSKQSEILMQQPSATLLIKKRMFSAIAENYKTDFMDKDELLFYKAMKVLFQNKCYQISRLEALSKVQKISESLNDLPAALVSILVSITEGSGGDTFGGNIFGGINNQEAIGFKDSVERLKRVYFFNKTNNLTKWITDDSNIFSTQFGNGTGVIEITNFTNFNTSSTLSISNAGSASFYISDPYNAMVITEYDIEKSISDVSNSFNTSKFFQFGKETSDQLINDDQFRLNQIRKNRGAGDITFHVSPDTIVGRRVRAIVDIDGVEIPFEYNPGLGGINNIIERPSKVVNVSEEYYKNGEALGVNGLDNQKNSLKGSDSELSLFIKIIQNLYNKIQMLNNIDSDNIENNENTNYARKKLRFMFLGKNIIQPMDSVHLYISSKSRYDNRLITGVNNMFTGVGVLQILNNSVANIKSSISSIGMMFGGSGSIDTVAEKNMYVGEAFPNYLWYMVRDLFVNEKEGTHVFAGLVSKSSTAYSSQTGAYTVSVNADDNAAYLKKGKINFKPGADVYNGSLFDPLTPFKTRYDTINSNIKSDQLPLLDENIEILTSGLLKFKSGPNAGQTISNDNLIQEKKINQNTELATKTFYAPDGLVYRWKEGIGSSVYSGNSLNIDNVETTGYQTAAKDPFAGQDVMNVISLLITGVPYNFSTYWRAVAEFDSITAEDTYNNILRSDLKKQNSLWGNFVPFKSLTMDEQSYKKTLDGIFKSNKTVREIEEKLQKARELRQQSYAFGAAQEISAEFTVDQDKINKKLTSVSEEINNLLIEAKKEQQNEFSNDYLNTGNQPPAFFENNGDKQSDLTRRSLRRKISYLTRRMSYNIRANEDKNLFIVDDFYDKDYDLMAFTKDLDGMELFRNEFTSVQEKITNASQVLQLEVFCDTQGHIKVRPPQYNRMPSSVFYKMIELKRRKGIQVFPQFLVDLFGNQIDTLSNRLEIIEDEIRLICATTGLNTDEECHKFINNNSDLKDSQFSFISVSGEITEFDKLTKDIDKSTQTKVNVFGSVASLFGDGNKSNSEKILDSETFSKLQKQSDESKAQYSIHQRSQTLLDAINKQQLSDSGYKLHENFMQQFSENAYIDQLISRIENKSGQKANKYEFISENKLNGVSVEDHFQTLDYFKLTNDLSNKIRERQKVMKLLSGAVKSAVEFRSLDDSPEQTRNRLLMPAIYGNKEIPEVFEHMIEDETYDDYGEGSGSRYIIKDAQIISFELSENAPEYTYVQVKGVLNPYGESLPEGLNNFPGGGNGLVAADAVDYDTWRMYGFGETSPVNIPFFNSPETQCLPYAAMLLGIARKNILRGSITIAGNEYMQQGEVVYLESRDLLFYVNSVSHNYTEGSEFRTTLDLTYGHTAGEYIPVPLDVIGKMMYNNKDIASYNIQRQNNVFNEKSLGTFVKDNLIKSNDFSEYKEQHSTYADHNFKTLSSVMFNASKTLSSNDTNGNNVKAIIELRVFYDDSLSSDLVNFAESIKSALTGNMMDKQLNPIATTGTNNQNAFDKKYVKVKKIQTTSAQEYRGASQKAISLSRNFSDSTVLKPKNEGEYKSLYQSQNNTQQFTKENRIKQALYENIVDCVIVFEEVSKEEANSIPGIGF